jgi:hypothetical protein
VCKGKVDLSDLILKKSALDKLDLPFGIVEGECPQHCQSESLPYIHLGRIGRFELNINWSLKGTTPLQVKIEDVQLLIAASSATEYSREDDETRQQQLKQERLDRAESLRIGEAAGALYTPFSACAYRRLKRDGQTKHHSPSLSTTRSLLVSSTTPRYPSRTCICAMRILKRSQM